MRRNVYL